MGANVLIEAAIRIARPLPLLNIETIVALIDRSVSEVAGSAYMLALALRLRLDEATAEIARLEAEVALLSGGEPPAVDLGDTQ